MKRLFKNDQIQINDDGIDLLRNSFPIIHLDYSNVTNYRVIDGFLLRNRFLILLFGLGFVIVSILVFNNQFSIYKDFFTFNIKSNGSIKGLSLLLFTPPAIMIFGGILIWQSFIKSKILQLFTDRKTYSVRIREIDKKGEMNELVNYLDYKVLNKNYEAGNRVDVR